MGDRRYDVVLCCGVLLYLDELTAERVMGVLLAHTRLVLGLICLAHPTMENSRLSRSEIRALEGGRIHNLDALVRHARGEVALRRWTRPAGPEESAPQLLACGTGGAGPLSVLKFVWPRSRRGPFCQTWSATLIPKEERQ